MAYKIFTKNNYFHIVDTVEGTDYEAFAKDALVRKKFEDSESYWFSGVNGFSDALEVPFTDIQDENGDAYADIATWETWYSTNTGNFNSGGATPQIAVYYVGGQDNTGFTGVVEKLNNTGIDFEFVREGVGQFSCAQFLQNQHFLISTVYSNFFAKFFYVPEDGLFYTQSNNTTPNDEAFEFGGWIKIEVY